MKPDRPATRGIAPGTEKIEVTPEMIEAGIDRLFELPELIVPMELLPEALKAAFCAMLRVHREQRAEDRRHVAEDSGLP